MVCTVALVQKVSIREEGLLALAGSQEVLIVFGLILKQNIFTRQEWWVLII